MAECPDNTIAGFATPAMTTARPRPIDRRTVCLAVAAGSFTAAAPWLSFADDLPPLDAVKKKVPQLETWLRDSRLGEFIEVVRPHRAPHPNQERLAIIHLETRWKRPIESRDQALAEFAAFASFFLQASGHSVQHKLLSKFAQICGVPMRLAAAHINVVDMDVAAYIAADGEPVTDVSGLRMARANATIPSEAPSATLHGRTVPDSDRVMSLLEQRFAARKGRFA